MRKMVCFLVLLGSVSFAAGNAAELKRNASASVSLREPATLTAPKGPRGWYWHGLVLKHDSVWNLRDDVYALRFEARNTGKTLFNGTATLFLAEGQGRRDRLERSSASFRISPSGEWQTIELPIASFDYARGEEYFLKFISRITLSGTGGETEVRNFRFIEAPLVKVSAPVRSKAAENGVNIEKVLLSGKSAGGHLSLFYAYSRKDTAPITPAAVVSYCGPTDLADINFYYNNGMGDTDFVCQVMSYACGKYFTMDTKDEAAAALAAVSPITYVDENTVPTVIAHGVKDDIVPFTNAEALDAKLTEYGVTHDFVIYPNSNHHLVDDPDCAQRADALLHQYAAAYLN